MKRKCLAVGIILLFVGTCLIPVTAQNTEKPSLPTLSGSWLYVGGDGPGNYTRIQDACDNASSGDTVFVYHGIYSDYFPEHFYCVKINKSINLVGENKFDTIINGTGLGIVVLINADDVSVSEFTLQNGGTPEQYSNGAGITIRGQQNIRIYDNILKENWYGINIWGNLRDILIYNNTIIRSYEGIGGNTNSTIKVYNNIISNNGYGVHFPLHKSSIFNNIISNNSIGLLLDSTGDFASAVYNNQIQENEIGLRIGGARLKIHNNNFINNKKQADIRKEAGLLLIPFLPFIRQRWINNYWDDWNKRSPRPILGIGTINIHLFIGGGIKYFHIGNFSFLEFDWHPSREPYDIPGMC